MANFTAQDVKDLRERTGCGMMDCKKALTESNGDVEKAIDDIMQSYEKERLNNRKFEILELLEGNLETNQKKELESELTNLIIRLAKIKQGETKNEKEKRRGRNC